MSRMKCGMRSRSIDCLKEWFESLVVVITVMACFRAYCFDWNKIPTGSMQPTLWGNHAVTGAERGACDVLPLSTVKWLLTGEKAVECIAPATGRIHARASCDAGFVDMSVGADPAVFRLPADIAERLAGRFVRKGETFWSGSVVSGDYVLVNKMSWNFRKPRAGEVMTFVTDGIGASPDGPYAGKDGGRYMLQQGAHFIKRMKATPGETYVLEHPLPGGVTSVTMGEDEYFACGDNYGNSLDSRYWGSVPGENLVGAAVAVIWPISGWRLIR